MIVTFFNPDGSVLAKRNVPQAKNAAEAVNETLEFIAPPIDPKTGMMDVIVDD